MNSDDDKFEDEITDILHLFNTSPELITKKTIPSLDNEIFFMEDANFDDMKNEIQLDIDEMFAMDLQMNNYMELLLAGNDSFHDDVVSKFNIISSDLLLEMQNNTKIYQAYYRLALRYREMKEKQKTNIRTLNHKNSRLQKKFDDISTNFSVLEVKYSDLNSRHLAEGVKLKQVGKLNLTKELEAIRRNNQDLRQQLKSSENENQRLNAEIEDTKKASNEKESQIELLKKEIKALKLKSKALEESAYFKEKECHQIIEEWNKNKLKSKQLVEENSDLKNSNEKSLLELQQEKDEKLVLVENEVKTNNENIMLKEQILKLNIELEKLIERYQARQNQVTESFYNCITENENLTSQNNKLADQLMNISKSMETIKLNGDLQTEEFERITGNLKLEILESKKANKLLHLRLLKANKMNSKFSDEITTINMELQRQFEINYYNAIAINKNKKNNSFGPSNYSGDLNSVFSIPTNRLNTFANLAVLTSKTSGLQVQDNNLISVDNKIQNHEGVRGSTSLTIKAHELQPLETMNVKRSLTFNNLSSYQHHIPTRPASCNPKQSNSFNFAFSTPMKSVYHNKTSDDDSFLISKNELHSTRTRSADLGTKWNTDRFSSLPLSAPNDAPNGTWESKLTLERSGENFLNADSLVDLTDFDVTDYDPDIDDDDIHHMETIYDSPRWIPKPKIKLTDKASGKQ